MRGVFIPARLERQRAERPEREKDAEQKNGGRERERDKRMKAERRGER